MWTNHPSVCELLASCAANPPLRDNRSPSFNRPTPMFRTDDERVAALGLFYKAAEPPVDSTAWRIWLTMTPQRAIADAIRNHRQEAA